MDAKRLEAILENRRIFYCKINILMNSITKLHLDNGDKATGIMIEEIFAHPLKDIIEYGFLFDDVVEYMETEVKRRRKEILVLLNKPELFFWRETGEDLIIDECFLEDFLGLTWTLPQLKNKLSKLPVAELSRIYNRIFESFEILKHEF